LSARRLIAGALFLMGSAQFLIHAQEKRPSLSIQERDLRDAWVELEKKPHDANAQGRYLNAFPHTYKEFLNFFVVGRNFSDGHEVILLLPSSAEKHQDELGKLLVNLGKDARWDADAPNYLQHITAVYAGQHADTFASLVNQLSVAERVNLITFLADAENHAAYPEYEDLINQLKILGQGRLAKEFEEARAERMRQPHG
jgi:hypothetical protein